MEECDGGGLEVSYGPKGGPGHRHRACHRPLVGGERSTGVPGRSSRGAAVGGRTVRLDSCSGREPFVPAGQPLVGGLCDTGVRGFRSYGKSSGGGVGVPCHCSSDLSYLIIFVLPIKLRVGR